MLEFLRRVELRKGAQPFAELALITAHMGPLGIAPEEIGYQLVVPDDPFPPGALAQSSRVDVNLGQFE